MDGHKYSTPGRAVGCRPGQAGGALVEEEKLRIVMEGLATARAISSTARRQRHFALTLLMTWRRALRSESMAPDVQQAGFARAMVAITETVAAEPSVPASGRKVIDVGTDRRIIVDAGVDSAALERVLRILERR